MPRRWSLRTGRCSTLIAALLVFSVSIDDYIVTSFVAGVGATTLPVHIYSMVRSGLSPEINAVSTVLLAATALLLFAAWRLEQGRRPRQVALPVALGLSLLALPFLLAPAHLSGGERNLNVYIWSNYIGPDTVRQFEKRHGVRVNVDVYDSNEALIAKMQSGFTRAVINSSVATTGGFTKDPDLQLPYAGMSDAMPFGMWARSRTTLMWRKRFSSMNA